MANEKQNKIEEPTKDSDSGHAAVRTAPARSMSEVDRSQQQPQYDSFMRVIRR